MTTNTIQSNLLLRQNLAHSQPLNQFNLLLNVSRTKNLSTKLSSHAMKKLYSKLTPAQLLKQIETSYPAYYYVSQTDLAFLVTYYLLDGGGGQLIVDSNFINTFNTYANDWTALNKQVASLQAQGFDVSSPAKYSWAAQNLYNNRTSFKMPPNFYLRQNQLRTLYNSITSLDSADAKTLSNIFPKTNGDTILGWLGNIANNLGPFIPNAAQSYAAFQNKLSTTPPPPPPPTAKQDDLGTIKELAAKLKANPNDTVAQAALGDFLHYLVVTNKIAASNLHAPLANLLNTPVGQRLAVAGGILESSLIGTYDISYSGRIPFPVHPPRGFKESSFQPIKGLIFSAGVPKDFIARVKTIWLRSLTFRNTVERAIYINKSPIFISMGGATHCTGSVVTIAKANFASKGLSSIVFELSNSANQDLAMLVTNKAVKGFYKTKYKQNAAANYAYDIEVTEYFSSRLTAIIGKEANLITDGNHPAWYVNKSGSGYEPVSFNESLAVQTSTGHYQNYVKDYNKRIASTDQLLGDISVIENIFPEQMAGAALGDSAANAIKQSILQKLGKGIVTSGELAVLIRENIKKSIATKVGVKIFNFLSSKHLHRFNLAVIIANLTASLYKDVVNRDYSMAATVKTLAGIIGGAYSGWAGAILGARAGAVVGSLGGAPGVVLGAAVGALIGGLAAGYAGSWASEQTVSALYAQMKKYNVKPGDYSNSLMKEQNKLVTSYTGRKLTSAEFYAGEGVLGNLASAVPGGTLPDTLNTINFSWPRK